MARFAPPRRFRSRRTESLGFDEVKVRLAFQPGRPAPPSVESLCLCSSAGQGAPWFSVHSLSARSRRVRIPLDENHRRSADLNHIGGGGGIRWARLPSEAGRPASPADEPVVLGSLAHRSLTAGSNPARRELSSSRCGLEPQWRRGRDSNPRTACTVAGFQDQCFRPLSHPSAAAECIGRPRQGRTPEVVMP